MFSSDVFNLTPTRPKCLRRLSRNKNKKPHPKKVKSIRKKNVFCCRKNKEKKCAQINNNNNKHNFVFNSHPPVGGDVQGVNFKSSSIKKLIFWHQNQDIAPTQELSVNIFSNAYHMSIMNSHRFNYSIKNKIAGEIWPSNYWTAYVRKCRRSSYFSGGNTTGGVDDKNTQKCF